MTKPLRGRIRAVKAWAVVEPADSRSDPTMLLYSIARTRSYSTTRISREYGYSWPEIRRDGFKCIPVLITPAKQKRRKHAKR